MAKYLSSTPDRYARFGHQSWSIAAGLLLSHLTGCKLIVPRYMYSCDKWNEYSDFSRSSMTASAMKQGIERIVYLETLYPDKVGNRKFSLHSREGILDILNAICGINDNSLICLPFDQGPGLLAKLFNKSVIRDDLKKVFVFSQKRNSPASPYVCIHIRRGDVTPDSHPNWYVNNDFYISLIGFLAEFLPSSLAIAVCTQGDASWLTSASFARKIFIYTTSQLFTNDTEIEDFALMTNADILFANCSNYSDWANILGSHKRVFDVSRSRHFLSNVSRLDPDSTFGSIKDSIIMEIEKVSS